MPRSLLRDANGRLAKDLPPREIRDAIAEGRDPYGMISFDQSLTDLVNAKVITYEDALSNATNPDDFALFFRGVSKGGAVSGPVAGGYHQPGGGGRPPQAQPAQGGFQVDRFKNE